jgi:hypothetical protein
MVDSHEGTAKLGARAMRSAKSFAMSIRKHAFTQHKTTNCPSDKMFMPSSHLAQGYAAPELNCGGNDVRAANWLHIYYKVSKRTSGSAPVKWLDDYKSICLRGDTALCMYA